MASLMVSMATSDLGLEKLEVDVDAMDFAFLQADATVVN